MHTGRIEIILFMGCRLSCTIPEGVISGKEGYKYQINLNPNGSLEFFAAFRPMEEAVHNFALTWYISSNSLTAGQSSNRHLFRNKQACNHIDVLECMISIRVTQCSLLDKQI